MTVEGVDAKTDDRLPWWYYDEDDGFDGPESVHLKTINRTVVDWLYERRQSVSDRVDALYALSRIAEAVSLAGDAEPVNRLMNVVEMSIGVRFAAEALSAIVSTLSADIKAHPEFFYWPTSRRIRAEPLPADAASPYPVFPYITPGAAQGIADDRSERLAAISAALGDVASKCSDLDMFLFDVGPRANPDEPVALYRWFDAADRLLYVGITSDMAIRQASHRRKSTWSQFAVRHAVEWYRTREIAETAERRAIGAEDPLFNHHHNDTPEARKRLVTYLVEKDRLDLLAPAVSRG